MNCLGYSSKTAWKSLKQVLQQGKSEAGDPGRTLSKRRMTSLLIWTSCRTCPSEENKF